IDPQIGRITLAISGSSPATLFASIAQRGANAFFKAMYKTTDGGATWTQLPGVPSYMGPYGDYNTTLPINPSNPNLVYAGGQTSIIRTTNGGSSWSFIDVGVHADHHGIGFDASGRFLDGNDGGIWRLDNPATLRWANLNGDLNTIQLTGIALDPTKADIAYGGAQDNGSEKFTDSLRWAALLGGDGGFSRVDSARHLTVYLTFQYTASSGFLFRSENGGSGLQSVTSGINHNDPANFYTPYVMDPSNSS